MSFFDSISPQFAELAPRSEDKIGGSVGGNNRLYKYAIIVYRTTGGRFGKMRINEYGYTLTLEWVTYAADGSVHSSGNNLQVRGTWLCDLDSGTETSNAADADFWWEQVNATVRYLVPKNGASFATYLKPSALGLCDVNGASLSGDKINGSDNSSNCIPAGTIVVYKTTEGRFGKLSIKEYGYNLTIRVKTYNVDGTTHVDNNDLTVRGTWLCDLDSGTEVGNESIADFWWEQVNQTERYLVPRNGATFAVFG